jgi:hypothetical protein
MRRSAPTLRNTTVSGASAGGVAAGVVTIPNSAPPWACASIATGASWTPSSSVSVVVAVTSGRAGVGVAGRLAQPVRDQPVGLLRRERAVRLVHQLGVARAVGGGHAHARLLPRRLQPGVDRDPLAPQQQDVPARGVRERRGGQVDRLQPGHGLGREQEAARLQRALGQRRHRGEVPGEVLGLGDPQPRERAQLADQRLAARGRAPQHEVVDRRAVEHRLAGDQPAEPDADRDDPPRARALAQPRGRVGRRARPRRGAAGVARAAGRVAGARKVDAQRRDPLGRQRQRPHPQAAVGADVVVAERGQEQHRGVDRPVDGVEHAEDRVGRVRPAQVDRRGRGDRAGLGDRDGGGAAAQVAHLPRFIGAWSRFLSTCRTTSPSGASSR